MVIQPGKVRCQVPGRYCELVVVKIRLNVLADIVISQRNEFLLGMRRHRIQEQDAQYNNR